MSYIGCFYNRPEMDIPLSICIWLSDEGVRALDRVFPYGTSILSFPTVFDKEIYLSDTVQYMQDIDGYVMSNVPFEVAFLSRFRIG